ncbi:early nodulin-93-like [Glycine soja]|uniref:early nodulin-93-like n=1 Tax=Glycine soja TaxID=3848 RepID=UPI00103C05B4|nr:early nodulin-93-like [Glycine soja]
MLLLILLERSTLASLDQKLAMAKHCSHEGVMAGAKAAVVATIATAIPTCKDNTLGKSQSQSHCSSSHNFHSGRSCIFHSS